MEGDEKNEAEDEGNHDEPRVAVDQALDGRIEEANAGYQSCHGQLH